MHKFLFSILVLLISSNAFCQCDEINPTILSQRLEALFSGAVLLCDEEDSELLSTQEYDSYQWYSQEYSSSTPNPNPWVAIRNATNRDFEATNAYFFANLKVEVTLDTCIYETPSIILDGFVYSLPAMLTEFEEGTFERVADEFNVCEGASVTFINIFPVLYNKHTWFKCFPSDIPPVSPDPCIIEGATGDTITVNESGGYTFYACTDYCPEQCQFLGTISYLNFGDWDFCQTTGIDDNNLSTQMLTLFPNPTQDYLKLAPEDGSLESFAVEVYNALGRKVLYLDKYSSGTSIDVTHFAAGTYIVVATGQRKRYRSQFVKN